MAADQEQQTVAAIQIATVKTSVGAVGMIRYGVHGYPLLTWSIQHAAQFRAAIQPRRSRIVEGRRRQIDDDTPIGEPDDAVCVRLRKMHLMQAADNCNPVAMADPAQQVEYARADLRVEARHRLIRDNRIRLLRQSARYRDALLLPAGKRIGALSGFVQETDAVEAIERQQSVAALETPYPATPRRHITEAAGQHVVKR